MATETQFGFSAQMMLFANENKRGISNYLLPIAEVVDRATKRDAQLTLKGDDSSGLVKALADAKTALAADTDNQDLKDAVTAAEKKLNKANEEIKRLGISLNFTVVEMKNVAAYDVANPDSKITDNAVYKNANYTDVFSALDAAVTSVKGLDAEALHEKEACKELSDKLDALKAKVQLNIVEIVKDVKNSKMSIATPVSVKKEELKDAFNLDEDGMAYKLIPGDSTIEQLSIDLKTKESAFEVIVKPDENFILNKQGDIFYLSRGSMILLRELQED